MEAETVVSKEAAAAAAVVIAGTEAKSATVKAKMNEVELVKCECCGLTEDCTAAYIGRVKERNEGRWICGLCAEAVKDEIMRSSERRIGREEALNRHMNFCSKFRALTPPPNPKDELISAVKQLMFRSLDSPRSSPVRRRQGVHGDFNYQEALTKSLIFLEAQRSGKLPPNHRPSWRGDSALQDGKSANVDLVGGYYDAGDNVKYGLPMAFTVTTLAWAAIAYHSQLQSAGELENVLSAIKWGTDYFLKASVKRNCLYVQVGDPVKDHECWTRPENMKTPRTVLMIDQKNPGTEIAAETSAAMAAASIVFRGTDRSYSRKLLNKAKQLFQFGKSYKGTYDGECPFYCSFSGFHDELLWAATWLYRATKRPTYLEFITEEATTATVAEFSWDLKYAGAQILLSKFYFEGEKDLANFKQQADGFICSNHPQSPHHQIHMSPGGLIHLRDGANSQYVTGAAFLFSAYSDYLAKYKQTVSCGDKKFNSADLMAFAKQQMDYLLGKNPRGKSYMVGFGNKPPTQAHHRGSSVPQMSPNKLVDCSMSFVNWYNTEKPNANELTGAIVGGPDKNDNFEDRRSSSSMTEPTTYTNSLAVGVLAKLTKHHSSS